MDTTLNNDNVYIRFEPKSEYNKASIYFKDLRDVYNETSAYTRKVRGINKAVEFIQHIFKDERLMHDLNFKDIKNILDTRFDLDVHTYCAMD